MSVGVFRRAPGEVIWLRDCYRIGRLKHHCQLIDKAPRDLHRECRIQRIVGLSERKA
jgi:hypothetical protein